jgi:DNA invertase Pin-like site-specific DNA recombinase
VIFSDLKTAKWEPVAMNFLYIDCVIKEQQREVREASERRRLLNWNKKMKLYARFEDNRRISKAELPAQIVETATTIFQTRGFENTKVVDVCRSLGISRLQFYRHFRSLDDVLETVWAG